MRATSRMMDVSINTVTKLLADVDRAKLLPSWLVGRRDANYAHFFVQDLASRLVDRIQLSTDGNKLYINAVERAFAADIDWQKIDFQRRKSGLSIVKLRHHHKKSRFDKASARGL